MPTTTTGLVLFIVATLIGFLVWWLQRRATPTTQDRIDGRSDEIESLAKQIEKCEQAGDFAGADALRRRMRDVHAPDGKRDAD